MATTNAIYCPSCRQWYEADTMPAAVGDKVTHGCGYEAVVTSMFTRSWAQTGEGDRPAMEHVPAEGFPDNSTTRQLTIMRQRAEDEMEQARAEARAKVVTLAEKVLAVSKDEAVTAMLAVEVPEAKAAAVVVQPQVPKP